MKKILHVLALLIAGTVLAEDGFLARPSGIKFNRLTLRPYVSFSYTFDSNPDCGKKGAMNSSYWTANPGVGLTYDGENWKLNGNAYYMYHAFSSGEASSLNNHSYGEQLGFFWSDIVNRGKGWALSINERYTKVNQNDDFAHSDGKGLWRDRQQFDAGIVLQRRFNETLYSAVNAGFYWIDYENDPKAYGPLYGWERWSAGAEVGVRACKWADVFLAGGYQRFTQDSPHGLGLKNASDGWTAHAGATGDLSEKLTYRVSGGVSTFHYAGADDSAGFTYEASIKWKITDTLMTSLLASSYYHPSEREAGSAVRCDSISWGIAKALVRNKLNATFDVAYRHDTHVYTYRNGSDWDINLLTARLSVNYIVNRLITVFARGEFQDEMNEGVVGNRYDYDRWRATLGVKFTY